MKYYPVREDENGISVELTPGITEDIKRRTREGEPSWYVFKHQKKGFRYIGSTSNSLRRGREHCRAAEKMNEKGVFKTSSKNKRDFRFALAKSPKKFKFGLIPVVKRSEVFSDDLGNHELIQGRGEVEKQIIKKKRTLHTEEGYNMNSGGGGPIGKRGSIKESSTFELFERIS